MATGGADLRASQNADSFSVRVSDIDQPITTDKLVSVPFDQSTRPAVDIGMEIASRLPAPAENPPAMSDRQPDDRQHSCNDLPAEYLTTGRPAAEAALCEGSLDYPDPTSGFQEWLMSSTVSLISFVHAHHSASKKKISGFNLDIFIQELDPKYQCRACTKGLRNPVQAICGHRFCESCIQELRNSDPETRCPIDMLPLSQVFKDRFCHREILVLCVRCSNFAKGCRWQGQLIDLEDHLKTCSWEVVSCPNSECKEHVLRKHLEDHLLDDCKFRRFACEHCKQLVLYSDLKIHRRYGCPEKPEICPYNCGAVVPRSKGTRQEVNSHESNPAAVVEHLNLACKVISKRTNEITILKAENEQKDVILTALLGRVKQLESKAAHGEQESNNFSLRLQQLEDSVVASKSTSCLDDALLERILSVEKISTSTEKNMTVVQRQLNDICSDVQQLSQQADTRASLVDTHDLRLLGLETASYNGVLIWKVNFEKAMADAQSGAKISLYSPPFYSSRYGYKMCARLYPLGDGIGRSTHMSFFVVIMNGEHDAILPWPFQQCVTMTLLDQSPSHRDISMSFLPDSNSSSFQRPMTTGVNIASGCPRFVTYEFLHSQGNAYIKDGIMFLKVTVDRTGLVQP